MLCCRCEVGTGQVEVRNPEERSAASFTGFLWDLLQSPVIIIQVSWNDKYFINILQVLQLVLIILCQ